MMHVCIYNIYKEVMNVMKKNEKKKEAKIPKTKKKCTSPCAATCKTFAVLYPLKHAKTVHLTLFTIVEIFIIFSIFSDICYFFQIYEK